MNSLPTATRVSAGGVVFRNEGDHVEVALILVAPKSRWQLPKGTVDENESEEDTALREVREETGLECDLIEPLDRIEYWFYASRGGKRVRFHKYVSFFLMNYVTGSVNDHDHEVEEARWIEINEAVEMLAFDSERAVLVKAQKIIEENEKQS